MHIYFNIGSTMINSLPFHCDKNNFIFLYRLRQNRIQKRYAIYQNRRSKRLENTHFAFICTICTRVQINLLHLESRIKFAPGCKFSPGRKFLKHRSHGQNCAYEPSFSLAQNLVCGYTLEPPHRGGFYEYPQSMI